MEENLKTLKALLAKSDGRDKVTATIQYALMFIHAGQAGKVKKAQGNVASARKVSARPCPKGEPREEEATAAPRRLQKARRGARARPLSLLLQTFSTPHSNSNSNSHTTLLPLPAICFRARRSSGCSSQWRR